VFGKFSIIAESSAKSREVVGDDDDESDDNDIAQDPAPPAAALGQLSKPTGRVRRTGIIATTAGSIERSQAHVSVGGVYFSFETIYFTYYSRVRQLMLILVPKFCI
jgi:hypothetical protein